MTPHDDLPLLGEIVPRRLLHATVEDAEECESNDWSITSSPASSVDARNSVSQLEEITEEELAARFHDSMQLFPRRVRISPVQTAIARDTNRLVVPRNFGQVLSGIYRSHFPAVENFPMLRMLGIKSILTLVPEEYPETHNQFIRDNRIQHFQIGIEPNKDPAVTITSCSMAAALRVVLTKANYPILIHCNKGKHRTGCVVACLRKILGWNLEDILNEYREYSGKKARKLDERYIELFEERAMRWLARQENYLPPVEAPVAPTARISEPFSESPISTSIVSTRLRG